MQLTKTHKIVISAVIILILLDIYITLDRRARNQNVSNNTSVASTTQTVATTTSGTQIVVQVNGSGKTGQVSIAETNGVSQPVPDLNRISVPAVGANISPETKTIADGKITELQALLKANPANLSAWIDIGIYQKMAGDYAGAVISWKYASKLSPTDFVPLGNLGNLYAYFLNDKNQAETYYKQAIANGPTQAYLYTQLAEVYRDIFNDTAKAQAIITQGLSKIPNDPNLLQIQASLK